MFDIAGTELLLLIALAVIFVGPKDLPRLMRALGSFIRKARMIARDFQRSFEDMADEADLKDLKEDVQDIKRTFDPGEMAAGIDEKEISPKKGTQKKGKKA